MRRALYGRALSAKVSVRLTSESYDGGVVHVMRLLFSGLPIVEALALDPRFAGKVIGVKRFPLRAHSQVVEATV